MIKYDLNGTIFRPVPDTQRLYAEETTGYEITLEDRELEALGAVLIED